MTLTRAMEITAYTTPDIYRFESDGRSLLLEYDRVFGLETPENFYSTYPTEAPTQLLDIRRFSVAPDIGEAMLLTLKVINDLDEPVNCHRYARVLFGARDSMTIPRIKLASLTEVDTLPEGTAGVIGAVGKGIVHTIGYSLGEVGMQSMSRNSEIGIAKHSAVVESYSKFYPEHLVGLYQLPLGRERELLTSFTLGT